MASKSTFCRSAAGEERRRHRLALRPAQLPYPDLYPSATDQTVVVVDGGYQEVGPELVRHIQNHLPHQRVDLVVSTHPDADHVNGLRTVLEKLDVRERPCTPPRSQCRLASAS